MTGERLGPYALDRELGAGGMGKVYAANVVERVLGLEVGARVAVKIVHPHLLETPGFFKRFLREGQIGQSVRHENVVRTLDCDAIGNDHFLVMEYVEGQTLSDLLHELDRVPEELCRHVGREICKGLAAIHAAGVVHRDLKPENVLITADHVVKVMDLGVARLIDESVRLSQTGAFVGSLHYAAPEQFRGGAAGVDARADLYALGVLLYEISGGEHPFVGDDVAQVLKKILHDEPRRIGVVNPQLSAFFEEVVHCLLAKDREQRFRTADELLDVLESGEDSAWWKARSRALQDATRRPLRRIRIPRETAVYGREKELERLRALFAMAKDGEGQVVLIEGEAGIGKSRLVDELIGRLQHDGEDVDFLFGSYPPGGAATAGSGFSAAYREQFGDAGSAGFLTQSPSLAPAFDAVLRGEPAPSGVAALNRESLATCFVHATRNLAAGRPTVVLIDDLHFAPEDARGVFLSLALAVPGHRILLLGTARPGLPEEWVANLTRREHVAHVHIDRLGPKDLVRLLQDSFRSARLAEELGARIALKSDGNPFFAFEIIRGLREGQFITQADDGSWVGTKAIDEIQIPSAVLDLVNARVAGLTEDERALLDVAACWGYEFDPALVGEVLGLSRIPTLRKFAQMERLHRLVRSSGRQYVFDHHQVQEALYGSLNEQLREEYHAALAETLETRTGALATQPGDLDGALCADLCLHFLEGARGHAALRYLDAAQTHMTSSYRHEESAALGTRALAVPGLLVGTERAQALLALNRALDTLNRRVPQEESAREAQRLADEAGDPRLGSIAAAALGHVLLLTARLDDAEAAYQHARESALSAGSSEDVVWALHGLERVSLARGRLDEAENRSGERLALAREIGLEQAQGTVNLGFVFYAQGRVAEARELFQSSLELFRRIGDRENEARATGNVGAVSFAEGDTSAAREHFEMQLALCRKIGDRWDEATATGNLGAVALHEGRLRDARDHQERCLVLSRENGDCPSEADALHNLASVLLEQDERDIAEAHLTSCLALCDAIGDRRLASATHLALGSLRAAAADADTARASFTAALALASDHGFSGLETLARCELALLPGGVLDAALDALRAHEHDLNEGQLRQARWLLWRATGDRAHLDEAKRLLDEVVAHVDDETRTSMLGNLRLNREIVAAWRAELGGDHARGGTEADTEVSL